MFSYKKFSCRREAARCLAKSFKITENGTIHIDRIRIFIRLPLLTMAVSVAVCEIFSVKESRDLENQVIGPNIGVVQGH